VIGIVENGMHLRIRSFQLAECLLNRDELGMPPAPKIYEVLCLMGEMVALPR